MEVVGWSPSEKLHESDTLLPHVEDGESDRCSSPSSFPFPTTSSSRFEPATAHQRRIKDPGHVPRPRNAFIIYRCDYTHKYIENGGSERACDPEKRSLSKRAGEAWRNEKPEIRRHYKSLAEEERAHHRIAHPDYRFRPKRQKTAGKSTGRRSPKRRASSPCLKRSVARPPSPVGCKEPSRNDRLQIQTITIPTSTSTLSHSYPSRQPTPDFSHGYGSTTPTSSCSPLSPDDDVHYTLQPTTAECHPDSLLPYSPSDCQFYGYPKDPLAPAPSDCSLFGQAYSGLEPISSSYSYPPLAVIASSLVGWDGNREEQMETMDPFTPKPTLHYESDLTGPFTSLMLSDGTMGSMDISFASDPVSFQSDMDAYRTALREYGITPAGIQ